MSDVNKLRNAMFVKDSTGVVPSTKELALMQKYDDKMQNARKRYEFYAENVKARLNNNK